MLVTFRRLSLDVQYSTGGHRDRVEDGSEPPIADASAPYDWYIS